jgi:branched-chain amino acid transport system substrate-binding protein
MLTICRPGGKQSLGKEEIMMESIKMSKKELQNIAQSMLRRIAMRRKQILTFLVSLCSIVVFTPHANAAQSAPANIVFGQVLCLTGFQSAAAKAIEVSLGDLWVEEVNRKGGLFIPQYKKRIPVKIIRYDDTSDPGKSLALYERLITVDKVDLTLPPHGSGWNVAAAPITNKYKQPWVVSTSSSLKFKEQVKRFPYIFLHTQYPTDQMPALADLMAEVGVKSAAVLYIAAEFGLQNIDILKPLLPTKNIEVPVSKSYNPGPTDLSPLLKSAQAANVDAVVVLSYPVDTFLALEQAISLNYSPKLLFLGVGSTWAVMNKKYGADTIEGILTPGGWTRKLNPEAEDFYNKWVAKYGFAPDFWGGGYGYSALQVLQQAIERVGFQDRDKLRDAIATGTFKTVIGNVRYVNQFNVTHPAQIAQWQKGVIELVAPPKSRTAKPVYPKPPWPKK